MAEEKTPNNPDTDTPAPADDSAPEVEKRGNDRARKGREKVVAVCFSRTGQLYWFHAGGVQLKPGQFAVADTEKGPDVGQVVYVKDRMEPGHPAPTKALLRRANRNDFQHKGRLREKAAEAIAVCEQKTAEHGLAMKLVRAEYTLNGRHLTFFFTAEGRVDFRELVRDLAQTFHCHIELRQIGVRDEAKMLGGMGPCGQPLCCARFLREFKPVGIRLAKDQDLPLNPEKISGLCDRLMCCLRYEHSAYVSARAKLPEIGTEVDTPRGSGPVVERNVLKQQLTVRLGEQQFATFPVPEVRPHRGEKSQSNES